ncbi:MAG: hypothetical protein ACRCW9_06150 [Cetobacterium sp.]
MKDFKLMLLQEDYINTKYEEKNKKEKAILKSNFNSELIQQESILGPEGLIFMQIGFSIKRDKKLRKIANYQIEKNKDALLKIIQNGLPMED